MEKCTVENSQLVACNLMAGFRINSQLLHIAEEKQIFKFKYSHNNVKYYVCWQAKCPVKVAVDLCNSNYCRTTSKNATHNHEPQEETIRKMQLMNSIKAECANISLKRCKVRDMFDEQCKKFKDSSNLVDFEKMRRQLYKIKSQTLPKTPTDFPQSDVWLKQIQNMVENHSAKRSDSAEPFYRTTIIEEDFGYSIFMSPTICNGIKDMAECDQRHYLIDGTFGVVPNGDVFKQLLVMHIAHEERTFPFAYILMSSKSEEAYTHALQHIHDNIFDMRPNAFTTDSDSALRSAITNVYPLAQMKTSWFHFTQAVHKNVSKIPCFNANLNEDSEAKKVFRKFLVLPLLKPSDLTAAYEMLKSHAMSGNFAKDHDSESIFQPFINCFERQWMEKEDPSEISLYNEPMWTTSSLESFHSQLVSELGISALMSKFIDLILNVDVIKSKDFKKSLDSRKRNNFIENCLLNLENKKSSLSNTLNQLICSENSIISNYADYPITDDEPDDIEDNDGTAKTSADTCSENPALDNVANYAICDYSVE